MPYMLCFQKKNNNKNSPKQKHLEWGSRFSGMDLREGNSICPDPSQPPFVYLIGPQICWTCSNSLVFEVQNFKIRVTCVHLVCFALLITVIFMKCLLYARSLTVYPFSLVPSPFPCLFSSSSLLLTDVLQLLMRLLKHLLIAHIRKS